jgi:23S rRNA pseudouridine955/2504/2580 synthase
LAENGRSESGKIPVRYQSGRLVVVQKPAGIAVQPGAGVRVTILDILEAQLGFRPFLVHRLDRDTEGLLILARNSDIAGSFSRLLNSSDVQKTYLAICSGSFPRTTGQMDQSIMVKGTEKSALTTYRLVRRLGKFALLELSLGTGRMHQIRIHLARAGHPILGDDQHGDFPLNRELKRSHGVKHLMLCAYRLQFPDGPDIISVTAELPRHMSEFLSVYNAVDSVTGKPGSRKTAALPGRHRGSGSRGRGRSHHQT